MDLTRVLEHRFETTVDEEGLDEMRTLIQTLAKNYLQQIVPSVEVKVLSQVEEDSLKFQMVITGILTIKVQPDPDAKVTT